MDTPSEFAVLTPAMQWGFAGVTFVLIGVIVWMIARLLDVLQANTTAMQKLTSLVEDVKETNADVRDRLLEWDCPYRGRDPAPTPK